MNEAAQKPREGSQQFPLTATMKQKPISTEEPLSCPFGPGGAGKEPKTSRFPLHHLSGASGQSWGWFIAVTRGAVLSWHSYIVLQHNASPLLKVTVERRAISFLNLLLDVNWQALSICNSIMPMKKNLGRKKETPLWIFCLKILMSSKHWVTFAYWHSLAPRFFL